MDGQIPARAAGTCPGATASGFDEFAAAEVARGRSLVGLFPAAGDA
jgi:hypothetical protein